MSGASCFTGVPAVRIMQPRLPAHARSLLRLCVRGSALTRAVRRCRRELHVVTSVIHHTAYMLLCNWMLRVRASIMFSVCLLEELPTFIMACGRLNKDLRSDHFFGATYFLLRVLLHTFLLAGLLMWRGQRPADASRQIEFGSHMVPPHALVLRVDQAAAARTPPPPQKNGVRSAPQVSAADKCGWPQASGSGSRGATSPTSRWAQGPDAPVRMGEPVDETRDTKMPFTTKNIARAWYTRIRWDNFPPLASLH